MTPLTDEQIKQLAARLAEPLADQIADRAFAKFQQQVGRSVIRNLLWLIVIGAMGLYAFWKSKTGGVP